MAERRSQVMIVADAWWEGPDGSLQKGRSRIVNKSASGACVRIEKRVDVGAKLRIESRWDEFCGVAKYCRKEGASYLVGIEREAGMDFLLKEAAKSPPNGDDRQRQETTFTEPPVRDSVDRQRQERIRPERRMPEAVSNRNELVRHENLTGDHPTGDHLAGDARVESTRIAKMETSVRQNQAIAKVAVEVLAPAVGYRKTSRRRWQNGWQNEDVRSQQWWEALAAPLLNQKEAPEERGSRLMGINWMGRGKQSAVDPKENGSASSGGAVERTKPVGAVSGDIGERTKAAAPVFAQPIKKRVAAAVDGDLTYQSDLMPLEEIYAAAGIVSPRRGYSIKKVMEMLHSEHLSALSKEMRRASVMMALDAAGVSVEEVLRDARVRLETIKAYEQEQKLLCEAEWARKAEEHAQLKAELEQVRERFLERMKQTLDGIARDRDRFGNWLSMIRKEAQNIAEAGELCIKAGPPALPPSAGPAADNVAPNVDEAKETTLKVV
jgi:hypothetical protein